MTNAQLDPQLQAGLDALCASEFSNARDILGDRLGSTRTLGARRLNLFLLSVAAASAGRQEVAESLLQQAHSTDKELSEPRHLSIRSQSPEALEKLRLLQLGWWDFNDWPVPTPSDRPPVCEQVNWEEVLDGTLEGKGQELDQKYSELMSGQESEARWLWNFVALAYLEAGDVRTYEDMSSQASPRPGSLPQELCDALSQRQLSHLTQTLQSGEWVVANQFEVSAGPSEVADAEKLPEQTWRTELESGFDRMAEGDCEAAARAFGFLSQRGLEKELELYTLNALALAMFRQGDYAEAEQTMRDFQSLRESGVTVSEQRSDFFTALLLGVEESPNIDSTFCDPFTGGITSIDPQGSNGEVDFWVAYERAVYELDRRDYEQCKICLRDLLSSPALKDRTLNFLTTVLWAGTAVIEGDHMAAQESLSTLSELFQEGPLDQASLQKGGALFQAGGGPTVGRKLSDPESGGLDIWQDFPADFGD